MARARRRATPRAAPAASARRSRARPGSRSARRSRPWRRTNASKWSRSTRLRSTTLAVAPVCNSGTVLARPVEKPVQATLKDGLAECGPIAVRDSLRDGHGIGGVEPILSRDLTHGEAAAGHLRRLVVVSVHACELVRTRPPLRVARGRCASWRPRPLGRRAWSRATTAPGEQRESGDKEPGAAASVAHDLEATPFSPGCRAPGGGLRTASGSASRPGTDGRHLEARRGSRGPPVVRGTAGRYRSLDFAFAHPPVRVWARGCVRVRPPARPAQAQDGTPGTLIACVCVCEATCAQRLV